MRADYGFSTSEIAGVAAEAACGDLRELGYLLKQAPMSWRWLEEGAGPQNMISMHQGLTELAGAAYAMQDAPMFLAAAETLLRYSLASSRSYTATPAQLLLDVALGIALHQSETARQAASAILAASGHDDPALSMPLEAAARTLVHLALGGMPMAELSAQELASAAASTPWPTSARGPMLPRRWHGTTAGNCTRRCCAWTKRTMRGCNLH
jgi:hypothetical protein